MAQLHSKMLIERRFPVRLGHHVDTLDEAYQDEKVAHWNPLADIPWSQLDADSLSAAEREAARLLWSRRLWAAFGYLSETPATLIRLCLELDRPISPKFFLTVRNKHEACHIDVIQKLAEAYGGYQCEPASPAYADILNLDLAQRVLHADTNIDAYILAHCAIKIGAEAALYACYGTTAANGAIASVLGHIADDKRRHVCFGWNFIRNRIESWTDTEREHAKAEIATVLQDIILSGYLSPFYAPDGVAEEEKAAEALVATAGLGSAPEIAQREAIDRYLSEVGETLRGWDIDLPVVAGS